MIKFNILSVLNSNRYKYIFTRFRENVKTLSKAWKDRPLPPLDTAIYWTEFAAKYPNYTYRTPAADVPRYQYYSLDVLGVLAIVGISVAYVIKLVLTLMCGKSKKNDVQSVKNKNKKKKKGD